jgi:hypothetical protein
MEVDGDADGSADPALLAGAGLVAAVPGLVAAVPGLVAAVPGLGDIGSAPHADPSSTATTKPLTRMAVDLSAATRGGPAVLDMGASLAESTAPAGLPSRIRETSAF